ncbi:MAG TPA: MFS transporter [Cytophagaceae bacterium]|jgi:predicted MFS family arabinose efflux permease
MTKSTLEHQTPRFSHYEILVIAILAITQFTVILDFMVLSPLGALMMETLHINTRQFGLVVSAYAFSAGASGLLAAGFADKFDRKKIMVFFYVGFIIGTLLCGIAPDYNMLLIARIVTGLFGGVIGSISMAIVADLFKLEVRGRVMGFVQMAFATSQVLGIPIGLYFANNYGWHFPFLMIVGLGILVVLCIIFFMKPVTEHLKVKNERNAFKHLGATLAKPHYLMAFSATVFLATGGFMLMPFASAFITNNLEIPMAKLPLMYGITGVFSMIFGPLVGSISDRIGKYKMFCIGSGLAMISVLVFNNLGPTAFWIVVVVNVCMFASVTARIITSAALVSGIPAIQDRGAFMSINSSVQQISGGIGSLAAGLIVIQTANGNLENYDLLGYVVIVAMIVTMTMMYFVNRYVQQRIMAPVVS